MSDKPKRALPKKVAEDIRAQVSSAKDFKTQAKGHPLEVRSGNVALVRRPGIQVFIKSGMVPNSLMPIIQKALAAGEKAKDLDFSEIAEDAKKLEDVLDLVDKVTCYCVIEPKVLPVPENVEDRDEEALYVDEVNFDDKVFIYQYAVGGTADLESFRAEQARLMGSVPDGEDLVDSTE